MTAAPVDPGTPVPVRRLKFVLRLLAGCFAIAALGYFIAPLAGPARGLAQTLPFVSNSIVKVMLLFGLCVYAAGDLRRYRGLVPIIIWAHVVSLGAMLLILALGDTSRVVDPGIGGPRPIRDVLLGASGLDGVILILLVVCYLTARESLPAPAAPDTSPWASPPEQWLRRILIGLIGLFMVGAILYEGAPLLKLAPDLVRELPFVTNSVVKVLTLALVAGFVVRDLKSRLPLIGPVIAVHFISVVAQLGYLTLAPAGQLDAVYQLLGQATTMRSILLGSIVLDGAIGVLLLVLYDSSWRARYRMAFFSPLEFRTLTALAEIMIAGADQPIAPVDAAHNVDRSLANLNTERKNTFRLALTAVHFAPLLSLRPPLPELEPAERRDYIEQRFYREAGERRILRPLRTLLQGFTRVGHQLSVLGYYNDPRVHPTIGFQPFSRRPRRPGEILPAPRRHPLVVERPWDRDDEVRHAEVCVIGSGAGGAIVAYTLAERGMNVLLLERGAYVEPQHFAEDELRQIGTLYQRGMLQVSEDFRFSVLQGNCVGGSTTVNNAIIFDPPKPVVETWNRGGAGLDTAELGRATDWLRTFLQVGSLGALPDDRHHPAARVIAPALARVGHQLGLGPPQPFDANIRVPPDGTPCFGCGNCNIGCAYDRKLSMLDHTLPLAQQRFPGKVTIIAECEAERFRSMTGRRNRVYELLARGSDGRPLRIRADRFVVAAGTIASSALLLRSGIGRGRPVGQHLAFNMLTPVFAEFAEPQNSYRGIQMGHYVRHAQDSFIIETWFSPPVGLATAMAGWFGDHYQNMLRSNHLVAYGLVVGTSATGKASLSLLNGDSAFSFTPPAADMARVGHGLEALATVLFEAGARRVMLNTWSHGTIAVPADIAGIRKLASDPDFITLASSHPQGGNAINRDPGKGVVDEQFRVHGYDNLYVTDASVFPGSVQVNPQMTVMSLARYAASRMPR
jgi:choline dehydrogenase-like flavoprotein